MFLPQVYVVQKKLSEFYEVLRQGKFIIIAYLHTATTIQASQNLGSTGIKPRLDYKH